MSEPAPQLPKSSGVAFSRGSMITRGLRRSPEERSAEAKKAWEGFESLFSEERTSYPLTLSVDDVGEGFALTAQVASPVEPGRVCALMGTALGWPLASEAQQARKLAIIGYLGSSTPAATSERTAVFVQRLEELGWIAPRFCHIPIRQGHPA